MFLLNSDAPGAGTNWQFQRKGLERNEKGPNFSLTCRKSILSFWGQ